MIDNFQSQNLIFQGVNFDININPSTEYNLTGIMTTVKRDVNFFNRLGLSNTYIVKKSFFGLVEVSLNIDTLNESNSETDVYLQSQLSIPILIGTFQNNLPVGSGSIFFQKELIINNGDYIKIIFSNNSNGVKINDNLNNIINIYKINDFQKSLN